MRRRTWIPILFVACALSSFGLSALPNGDHLARLPGAALLTGYPPFKLMVTTPYRTLVVQEGKNYLRVYPTMSADGTIVASAREKGDLGAHGHIVGIATYSVAKREWAEYGELDFQGTIAVSPDGSKLAYPVRDPVHDIPARLRIVDLRTRSVSDSPVIGLYSEIMLSWSPDGQRIVYEMNQSTPEELILHRPAIFVIDVQAGEITKIADGEAPAWSPSGKWIAYFDHSEDVSKEQWGNAPAPDRLSIIRPDGTGSRVLVTLPRDRAFAVSPVWSPDSKTILLNEIWDQEKGTVSIHLLDLATLKLSRKFKDVPPVFGWAEAK